MREPCNNCPFRHDVPPYLFFFKKQAIVESLHHDGDFPCHKTTTFDEDGELINLENTRRCIGAAIFLEKVIKSGCRANLAFRLALMFKEFTIEELNLDAPVFDSVDSFLTDVLGEK